MGPPPQPTKKLLNLRGAKDQICRLSPVRKDEQTDPSYDYTKS